MTEISLKSKTQLYPNILIPKLETFHSLPLTNFLTTFFNLLFYLGCCPFRLVSSQTDKSRTFYIYQNLPQKLFCCITTLLCSLWIFRDCRPPYSRNFGKHPASVFQTVLNIVNCFAKLITLKQIWWDKQIFVDILNHIALNQDLFIKPYHTKVTSKPLVYVVCLIYTSLGIIEAITGQSIISSRSDLPTIYKILPFTAPCSVYVNCSGTCRNASISQFVQGWDNIFSIDRILDVGWLYRRFLGAFSELILLMSALTLWTAAKEFATTLKKSEMPAKSNIASSSIKLIVLGRNKTVNEKTTENPMLTWELVLRHYQAIKRLAELINSAVGLIVICFLIVSILDYAISFDEIFIEETKSKGWNRVLVVLFYCVNACAILGFSADVCRQMTYLKHWFSLEENQGQVPLEQLFLITNQLDNNVVAIKGGGIFPITYNLVANILGVTVTYFIICVQA